MEGEQIGSLSLQLDGDFNYANAAAAIAIAHAVGFDFHETAAKEALRNMEPVRIAGRMEHFHDTKSNTIAIVDYAHNYASVTALLDFVYERWGEENPRITLVTGSAGNKAYDRRKEIVEAAENRIANFIFTAEDTDTEPIIDICMEMQGYITNKDVVHGDFRPSDGHHQRHLRCPCARRPIQHPADHRQGQRALDQGPSQACAVRRRRSRRRTHVWLVTGFRPIKS